MNQPTRRMSDIAPSRPAARSASSLSAHKHPPARPIARPIPKTLRHPAAAGKKPSPTAHMAGSTSTRVANLRKQAEHQARIAAAYQGRAEATTKSEPVHELADPAYAAAPLHPLPTSSSSEPATSLPVPMPTPAPGYAEQLIPPTPKRKLFGRKSRHLEPIPELYSDAFADIPFDEGLFADEPPSHPDLVEPVEPAPSIPERQPELPAQALIAPGPMRMAAPTRSKRRGLRIAAQLLLSLVIILGVAVAIVAVYVRFYQ